MTEAKIKLVSTSALSKQLKLSSKELFSKLLDMGWIVKSGDNWELTEQGRNRGGTYREHQKFGKYIAWPENIDIKDHENDKEPPRKVCISVIRP